MSGISVPAVPHGASVHQLSAKDIPEGAVPISDNVLLNLQWRMISKWQPQHEMWMFQGGIGAIGGGAVLSGVVFNNHFRKKLQLVGHGRIMSFVAATVIPATLSMLTYYTFVGQKVMLGRISCPACAQVRAACIQTVSGVVQPFFLAIFTCSALAKTNFTYALPQISNPAGLLKVYNKMTQPLAMTATLLLAANLITVVVVTDQQMKGSLKLKDRLVSGRIYQ